MSDIITGIMIKNMAREMVRKAAVNGSFEDKIQKTKEERAQKVEQRIKDTMSKLDYSKHDKRNNKSYVESLLRKYYQQNLNSTISPQQWDEAFSHYSPYSGTY